MTSPIYNLVQHLRDTFPADAGAIYCNVWKPTGAAQVLPDRRVLARQTGSPAPDPVTKFTAMTVQVLVVDLSSPAAEQLAKAIYDELHGRFGLVLPAALNVGGVDYAGPVTAQISAIQYPYCLGLDDAGRTLFTTNFKLIFKET